MICKFYLRVSFNTIAGVLCNGRFISFLPWQADVKSSASFTVTFKPNFAIVIFDDLLAY